MKIIKHLAVGVFTLATIELLAQATQPSNVAGPFLYQQYLGFSNNFPLALRTNGFNRFKIENGFGGLNAGRISIGNNLPNTFAPQSRVHIHQAIFPPLPTNETYIRFTNNLTGPTATDGFAIGNSSNLNGPFGDVLLQQYEQAPLIIQAPNAHSLQTLPYEWLRVQNGTTFQPTPIATVKSTDGFVGLNNPNPRAHIDIITPAFNGGEEFIMAKPDDVNFPNVQMGLMNLAGQPGRFLPGVFGNINHPSQFGPALQMLGTIPVNQDLTNREPIMRFMVGRDWITNGNIPGNVNSPLTQTIVNRPIFSWQNADLIYMYMSANGRARIGFNIATGILPNIPEWRANNRFEITADAIDPYYDLAGNPAGNPNWNNATIGRASGLRFTFLTSRDLVQVPNATNQIDPAKVLTTDRNGDVVMINTLANANNGLSVTNGTLIQLGTNCPATTTQVTASQLLNNRQIPMNGFNTVWAGATGSVGIGLPINACIPNNKLEVDNNTGPNPLSGLRLTDLAGAAPLPPNNQMLSVNAAGDVILTQYSVSAGFGNLCTAPQQNPLPGTYEIPLNTFQYKFTGQGLIDNVNKEDIVSVGYPCNVNPPSRFSVLENQNTQPVSVQTYAGHFSNFNASTPLFTGIPIETAGLYSESKRPILGPPNYVNHNIGAIGEATGSINSIGVVGRIAKSSLPINQRGARYAIGGAFMSDTAVSNITLPSVENYGVYASAFNSPVNNYGVYAETAPDPNGVASSYAVFAKTTGANPTFPSLGGNYAGYFDGDVVKTGADNFSSDAILKQNFDSIPNALGIINQLKPKTFDYRISQFPQMALPNGLQYGLVAQDVQTVVPAIVNAAVHPESTINNVTYPAFTYSTVEYTQLIPILIKAVQQLSAQNQKLDSLVTALTQTVSSCCSNSAARETGVSGNNPKALSQININLSDEDFIVLNQNEPNPFAEQTTITYNVPEKYGFAQLVFKTIDGKIIKTVDITKKGRGQVNVFASDLSKGLYMYTLIVDGNVIDTKKMIKQ